MVTELETSEQFQTILDSGNTVIIKFYAPWCAPCKGYATIFDNASVSFEESFTFVSINTELFADLVHRYKIKSVPTTLKVKGDEILSSYSGAMSEVELANFIM